MVNPTRRRGAPKTVLGRRVNGRRGAAHIGVAPALGLFHSEREGDRRASSRSWQRARRAAGQGMTPTVMEKGAGRFGVEWRHGGCQCRRWPGVTVATTTVVIQSSWNP